MTCTAADQNNWRDLGMLESIQGTGRPKFEDEQGRWAKTSDALYQMVITIDFRPSEMPPLQNNDIFKSVCWTFADPLNRL